MHFKKKKNSEKDGFPDVFKRIDSCIKDLYPVNASSVYVFDNSGHQLLYGEKLEDNIIIDRYMSFSNTVIMINPTGISENEKYKSRVITQLRKNNTVYLIVFSSIQFEAFRDAERLVDLILKEAEI